MIIWINGAFGSGKTQTAQELRKRIPNSYIYDPENLGIFIRENIPTKMKESDFQDYQIWRDMNLTMLSTIYQQYDGIIIVPMTIVNPNYFDEIVGRLRENGVLVSHFTLCATKETLQNRLKSRGEKKNSWAEQQIDRCIEGLSNTTFENHINTNTMTIKEIVDQITSTLNINLSPNPQAK